MKFIELTTQVGNIVKVSDLPEEVRELISSDDIVEINVIDYPLSETNNLILSPILDWDMGSENISRSIINLDTIAAVGVFNGPSCDVYKKIDEKESAWILYTCVDEIILIKI